jgi:hypothetical protein
VPTEAGLPGWFPEDFNTDPALLAAFEDDADWHAAGRTRTHQHAVTGGSPLDMARQADREQAEAAIADCLRRADEIALAMAELAAHPRLSGDPDFSTGPDLSVAEVVTELRAAMGLAARAQTPYEAGMPPVADLARTIGLR